jgi:hypothetical protein
MTNGTGSVPLTNGSGSGRTKNIRIRIPNTDGYLLLGLKGSGAKKVFLLSKKLQNIAFIENFGSPLQNNTFRKKNVDCAIAL